MRIELHPTDAPLTASEREHLAKLLPDPATSACESIEVPMTRYVREIEPLDVIEVPNDALGLPPPGRLVARVEVWRFARRPDLGQGAYWYRLPGPGGSASG